MKRIIIILCLLLVLIISLFITKAINGGTGTDETTTTTTEAVETTTEVEEETTEAFVETTTGRYEDPALFKKVEINASDLPFEIGYADAVGKVYMYIPTGENGDADVWDNTHIVVEHRKERPVILKLDKADGILTDNIILDKEMTNANWTFIYLDGVYTQNKYTLDRDGDMIILKEFPEDVHEIKIHNRSSSSIYEGMISGKKVYVNDIIIKVVD